jgi:hypothetical protein
MLKKRGWFSQEKFDVLGEAISSQGFPFKKCLGGWGEKIAGPGSFAHGEELRNRAIACYHFELPPTAYKESNPLVHAWKSGYEKRAGHTFSRNYDHPAKSR